MTELNKAIAHLISACGMKDEELSRRTGIPAVSIGRYRRGEGEPSIERAVILLSTAYKAKPRTKDIPERAKYKSIGDMLYREDVEK